ESEFQSVQEGIVAMVPVADATVTAVSDGAWSEPATWSAGVPGAESRVYIPDGRRVTYDTVSDTPIAWIRVDGTLTFSTQVTTRLTVDTLVVTDIGHLAVGSRAAPVPFGASAEIVFANVVGQPEVDENLGLGLLAFGRVDVNGAPKSPFHRTTSLPAVGATEFTLIETPIEWAVGDRLLVPATMPARHGGVDELVTITAIDGANVTFTPALAEQRVSPRADLTPHVANLTRSVVFRSANTAQPERGHIQLLHRREFDVRYASLTDLARSDKINRLEGDNLPNRYPLYVLHNGPGSSFEDPSRIVGNVVERSIGQAFVVNDSHVALDFNVAYDVVGGGFVIEGGNETGAMRYNLAVHATGRDTENHPKSAAGNFEIAAGGVGFWSNSRLIYNFGNVAANTKGYGFVYFHRGTAVSNDRVRRKSLDHPDAVHGLDYGLGNGTNQDKAAIQGFHDNEAYGTELA
ncbi:MAG: G8 domain-containing protein, partial [Myxococcota bacterium]